MSRSVDLADAIVELLNSEDAEWSLEFVALRRAVPIFDFAKLTDLQVSVFSGTRSADRRTRSEFGKVYKPTVSIAKKLRGGNDSQRLTESDSLQTLAEEIEALLESDDNAELAGLNFQGFNENELERDSYSIELLRSESVFEVIIGLQYES